MALSLIKFCTPFRASTAAAWLIEDGLAESVMLAHLSVPALDKLYPSSLSYKTVNNLLRDEYGFNGIAITDALDMKGVLQDPNVNVDLKAFEVGNDIILMSTNVSQGVQLISESYRKYFIKTFV